MSTAFLHTIVASNPFGADTWDLTELATELHITNISPGGHGDAEIIYEDIDPMTVPPPGANLVISDALGPYWVGRVEEANVAFRPGGGKVTVLGRGMGSSAGDQVVTTALTWDPVTGQPYPFFKQG